MPKPTELKLDYYTTSTCCTCGRDGVLLGFARMHNVTVNVHIITDYPAPIYDDLAAGGVQMPIFRDPKTGKFYGQSLDYVREVEADGDNNTAV